MPRPAEVVPATGTHLRGDARRAEDLAEWVSRLLHDPRRYDEDGEAAFWAGETLKSLSQVESTLDRIAADLAHHSAG